MIDWAVGLAPRGSFPRMMMRNDPLKGAKSWCNRDPVTSWNRLACDLQSEVMLSHVKSCWVMLSHIKSCWVILLMAFGWLIQWYLGYAMGVMDLFLRPGKSLGGWLRHMLCRWVMLQPWELNGDGIICICIYPTYIYILCTIYIYIYTLCMIYIYIYMYILCMIYIYIYILCMIYIYTYCVWYIYTYCVWYIYIYRYMYISLYTYIGMYVYIYIGMCVYIYIL